MMLRRTGLSGLKKGIFIGVMAIAGIFGLTWLVMELWNHLLPEIIHVERVSFWQAMGILVLSKILFGGMKFGGNNYQGRNRFKEKFGNMSEEDKEAFKQKMKERWGRNC